MIHPRCILFDFGQTLMQTNFDRQLWIERWLELSSNPGNVTTQMVREYADVLIEASKPIRDIANMEFSRRQFERNLCDRLGVSFDLSSEELDIEFVKTYIQMPEPGVTEMLTTFSRLGIRMGVVSNSVLGGHSLAYVLEKHGLLQYFDYVMSSADYGFRKPHPQIFMTALAKSGSKPEETWFIGDSLSMDVAGAQKVGIKAVWYNPNGDTGNDAKPDVEISSWKEFVEMFSDKFH